MDSTDPEISFDHDGRCSHCREFDKLVGTVWHPDAEGELRLAARINEIKRAGKRKQYDCVIGLSGGVDSSYLAVRAKEWGLRPLLVHVDGGWNTELAVENIERIVAFTGFELHTHVVNWEAMRSLQLAYLRAGVANQDVPQDHAFFAGLYNFATRNGVRYVISGHNVATEGILPAAWGGPAMDASNLLSINSRFGTGKLQDYPTVSFFKYFVWYPRVLGMKVVRPLDCLPYSKDTAIEHLVNSLGWRPYARKHGESVFTKFFQNYYLPERFGFDKRRAHYSSLVAAGSMSRQRAADLLTEPLYSDGELVRDKAYLCKKLKISLDEFEALMNVKPHTYHDFETWERRYRIFKKVQETGRSLRIRGARGQS